MCDVQLSVRYGVGWDGWGIYTILVLYCQLANHLTSLQVYLLDT